MPSSRGSSQSGDWTQVSCIASKFFTVWATRETQEYWSGKPISSPGDFPDPGIEPGSPAFAGRFFNSWATREGPIYHMYVYVCVVCVCVCVCMCMCMHIKLLQSCLTFSTIWTIACQAPLSMGFSRHEYWSGLACPPPGDLLNPRLLRLPHCRRIL